MSEERQPSSTNNSRVVSEPGFLARYAIRSFSRRGSRRFNTSARLLPASAALKPAVKVQRRALRAHPNRPQRFAALGQQRHAHAMIGDERLKFKEPIQHLFQGCLCRSLRRRRAGLQQILVTLVQRGGSRLQNLV